MRREGGNPPDEPEDLPFAFVIAACGCTGENQNRIFIPCCRTPQM
jgi:hypothetical protein